MPPSTNKRPYIKAILANFPEAAQRPYEKKNLIIADENISSCFVEVLNILAYLHKVTSVNYPFKNLGLYKGMTDSELVEVAKSNNDAPIITKDLDIGKIYPKTILLPFNGHKEREGYILDGLEIVFSSLYEDRFPEYGIALSIIHEINISSS